MDRANPGSDFKASIAYRQSDRPAAAAVLAFSMGIGSSLPIGEYSFASLALAGASLAGASFLALRKNRLTLALALGLAAICLGGMLMAIAQRDGFSDADLRSLLPRRAFRLDEPVSFEGCVADDSVKRGDESTTVVDMRAFLQNGRWIPCKGKGIIRIAGIKAATSPPADANLLQGDRVRGWAVWHIPRNYGNPGSVNRKASLARRGIFIIGRVKSPRLLETVPGGCASPWTKPAVSVREHVRTSFAPIGAMRDGQPAAILASLTVGDYSGLDTGTREVFQNSGTFHVLIVSGLHVAWIAGVLLLFLKWAGVPERLRYLLAALVIYFYTLVVGFQASLTRCLWMFILYLLGRFILRRASAANILCASALLLLAVKPDWLLEAGFQLSFLSVTAIALTAAPAIENHLRPLLEPLRHAGDPARLFLQPGRWHRLGRNLRARGELLVESITEALHPVASAVLFRAYRMTAGAIMAAGSMVLVSIAIQFWIEPVLACRFNRMSWIAPFSNLLIVPLSSLTLAAGLAASLLEEMPYFGNALLRCAGLLASLLSHGAAWTAALACAWQRCPTPTAPWIVAGILLLFAWSFFRWRHAWIPYSYILILLACLSLGSVPGLGILIRGCKSLTRGSPEVFWPENAPVLSFTFLDVGEGDSAFIRFPDGRKWLVDAGGLLQGASRDDNAYAFDIGEAVVSRYLWHAWITRLDRLVLSHTDLDHAGGAPSILKNFRVTRLDCLQPDPHMVPDRILTTARQWRTAANQPCAGVGERVGPVRVRVLHPPADFRSASSNDNSLVLEFAFKRFSALLNGDLEKSGEAEVLSHSSDLQGLLLKVAHHGSRSATTDALLERAGTRWAIISAGRNNPYGHPSSAVMDRLQRHGAQAFLTMNEGAITFETDGEVYVISSYIRGVLDRGELE